MIYNLKYNEMSKLMREFGKTLFGKIIFIIFYTPFFLGLIASIVALIFYFKKICYISVSNMQFILIGTIFLLCFGSYGYYRELRIFSEKKIDKKEK